MGASWVTQNILKPNPDADLDVFVVWVPALGTDARDEWDPSAIPDERVHHFWDGDFQLAGEFADQLGDESPWVYDVYAVYDEDARWGDAPVGSGGTVIAEAEQMRDELTPLLGS